MDCGGFIRVIRGNLRASLISPYAPVKLYVLHRESKRSLLTDKVHLVS